jgi:hypothetical protein
VGLLGLPSDSNSVEEDAELDDELGSFWGSAVSTCSGRDLSSSTVADSWDDTEFERDFPPVLVI